MNNLPKKFPEYSLMYKTLSNRIKELEIQKESADKSNRIEIELKISRYQAEKEKIKEKFPKGFFEDDRK